MEFTGKTIDLAIKEGLSTLNATLDEVEVKIVNEGGLFKKAKVEMNRIRKTELLDEVEEITKETTEQEEVIEEVVEESIKEEKTTEKRQPRVLTEEEKEKIQQMVADVKAYIKEYLEKMCYIFNQIGDVEIVEDGRDLHVNLKSNIRQMIGYHGDSLDAYQFLLTTSIGQKFPHFRGRVYLDVDSYKANREKTLVNLAKRMANKVVVARKAMKLEPMKSFERKIVHNAINSMPHIQTHSEGTEPKRYIVIEYVD